MREIKFRAWDGTLMWTPDYIDEFGNAYASEGDIAEANHHNLSGNGALMQYTGLKDKNGIEIYEADLVNVFFTSGDGAHNHDCIYKVGINPFTGVTLAFVGLLWESYGHNQFPTSTNLRSEYRTLGDDYQNQNYDRLAVLDKVERDAIFRNEWKGNDYSNYIEVIGNIYENPELLKGA